MLIHNYWVLGPVLIAAASANIIKIESGSCQAEIKTVWVTEAVTVTETATANDIITTSRSTGTPLPLHYHPTYQDASSTSFPSGTGYALPLSDAPTAHDKKPGSSGSYISSPQFETSGPGSEFSHGAGSSESPNSVPGSESLSSDITSSGSETGSSSSVPEAGESGPSQGKGSSAFHSSSSPPGLLGAGEDSGSRPSTASIPISLKGSASPSSGSNQSGPSSDISSGASGSHFTSLHGPGTQPSSFSLSRDSNTTHRTSQGEAPLTSATTEARQPTPLSSQIGTYYTNALSSSVTAQPVFQSLSFATSYPSLLYSTSESGSLQPTTTHSPASISTGDVSATSYSGFSIPSNSTVTKPVTPSFQTSYTQSSTTSWIGSILMYSSVATNSPASFEHSSKATRSLSASSSNYLHTDLPSGTGAVYQSTSIASPRPRSPSGRSSLPLYSSAFSGSATSVKPPSTGVTYPSSGGGAPSASSPSLNVPGRIYSSGTGYPRSVTPSGTALKSMSQLPGVSASKPGVQSRSSSTLAYTPSGTGYSGSITPSVIGSVTSHSRDGAYSSFPSHSAQISSSSFYPSSVLLSGTGLTQSPSSNITHASSLAPSGTVSQSAQNPSFSQSPSTRSTLSTPSGTGNLGSTSISGTATSPYSSSNSQSTLLSGTGSRLPYSSGTGYFHFPSVSGLKPSSGYTQSSRLLSTATGLLYPSGTGYRPSASAPAPRHSSSYTRSTQTSGTGPQFSYSSGTGYSYTASAGTGSFPTFSSSNSLMNSTQAFGTGSRSPYSGTGYLQSASVSGTGVPSNSYTSLTRTYDTGSFSSYPSGTGLSQSSMPSITGTMIRTSSNSQPPYPSGSGFSQSTTPSSIPTQSVSGSGAGFSYTTAVIGTGSAFYPSSSVYTQSSMCPSTASPSELPSSTGYAQPSGSQSSLASSASSVSSTSVSASCTVVIPPTPTFILHATQPQQNGDVAITTEQFVSIFPIGLDTPVLKDGKNNAATLSLSAEGYLKAAHGIFFPNEVAGVRGGDNTIRLVPTFLGGFNKLICSISPLDYTLTCQAQGRSGFYACGNPPLIGLGPAPPGCYPIALKAVLDPSSFPPDSDCPLPSGGDSQ